MTTALDWVRGQRHAPAALYPRERAGTHCTEAGWAPGPVWTDAEILAPPGFEPPTVQPIASRYTDYATRPTFVIESLDKNSSDSKFCSDDARSSKYQIMKYIC